MELAIRSGSVKTVIVLLDEGKTDPNEYFKRDKWSESALWPAEWVDHTDRYASGCPRTPLSEARRLLKQAENNTHEYGISDAPVSEWKRLVAELEKRGAREITEAEYAKVKKARG